MTKVYQSIKTNSGSAMFYVFLKIRHRSSYNTSHT